MRRPIQIQLLVPTLSVVVLAIVLASGASGYFGAMRQRQSQENSLRRVVATLAEGRFPLTKEVLQQMSGLSGAEFVFLDADKNVLARTLPLSAEDEARLRRHRRAAKRGTRRPRLSQPADVRHRPRPRHGFRLARRALFAGAMVGRDLAGRLPGAGGRRDRGGRRGRGRDVARPALRAADPSPRRPDRAIAQGDFTPVAVGDVDDELRDLAVSINRMTERLSQYEREVRRSEQLRTLSQLGAGMAHQLRNAATGSRMAIELHQRQCGEDAEALEVALRQLRLMESYLQRFLALGRPKRAIREPVPLAALVDDVYALVRPACLHAGIELSVVKPETPICVLGDAEELRQLLLNLAMNAVDAVAGQESSSKRIELAWSQVTPAAATLCVRDSGPGPSPEVAARLFEPFVTGKPEGTGLGLFVARQIAEDHGGTIRWQRCGGMTEFRVELPVAVK